MKNFYCRISILAYVVSYYLFFISPYYFMFFLDARREQSTEKDEDYPFLLCLFWFIYFCFLVDPFSSLLAFPYFSFHFPAFSISLFRHLLFYRCCLDLERLLLICLVVDCASQISRRRQTVDVRLPDALIFCFLYFETNLSNRAGFLLSIKHWSNYPLTEE